MSTQAKTFLTPEQYLEIERQAERKSEYYAGEMFAMAGASRAHNRITANAIVILHESFRGRPCGEYPSDMRVGVNATGLYTYPDVVAVCGSEQYDEKDPDTLLNPTLIIEVLSPSTEAYDRGRKFEHYRTIPSLLEYVLIASDRVQVDVYTRETAGRWILTSAADLSDAISLTSVDCNIKLSDLYEKTELPSPPLR